MRRLTCCLAVACAAACGAGASPEHRTAVNPTLAIEDVTVVPMDGERMLPRRTVLIAGDRIVRIAAANEIASQPSGVTRVDGRGRFLIPGLADLHVHIWEPEDLLLYIANGVTTVRNMNGRPEHLDWRRQIRRGELLGPDLYTSGPTIYSDPADAEALVAGQQKAGYDFVKLYHFVSVNGYRSVLAAARARDMRVVGHKPSSPLTSADTVRMGMDSLEHLVGFATQLERLPSPLRDALIRGEYSFRYTYAGVDIDDTKLQPAAEDMAASGGWICPTLVALDRWAPAAELAPLMKRPHMRFVSPRFAERAATWDEAQFLAGSTPENRAQGRRVRRRIVKHLHAAGARLVLGTDAGSYLTEPGFSCCSTAIRSWTSLTPEARPASSHAAAGSMLKRCGTGWKPARRAPAPKPDRGSAYTSSSCAMPAATRPQLTRHATITIGNRGLSRASSKTLGDMPNG